MKRSERGEVSVSLMDGCKGDDECKGVRIGVVVGKVVTDVLDVVLGIWRFFESCTE